MSIMFCLIMKFYFNYIVVSGLFGEECIYGNEGFIFYMIN